MFSEEPAEETLRVLRATFLHVNFLREELSSSTSCRS
jgi:hypothetical protein